MLPPAERLVEPFVDADSVFLNTDFDSYRLSDINQDLINLYQIVPSNGDQFIADAAI
jgi:DNA adenine methylase